MFGIFTNYNQTPFPADNFTFITNFFNRSANFHYALAKNQLTKAFGFSFYAFKNSTTIVCFLVVS